MTKTVKTKHQLRSDANGTIMWMDGGHLPHGLYNTEEISGIQISMMIEGYDDVYIVMVTPGDDYSTYDAWIRRMGSTDMVHILSRRARDPENVVVAVLEALPDYIPELGGIM